MFYLALTIIFEIFMNELVLIIAPGFEDPLLFDNIVFLSDLQFCFTFSFVALFGSMLNAPVGLLLLLFSIILNICLILACLTITESMQINPSLH